MSPHRGQSRSEVNSFDIFFFFFFFVFIVLVYTVDTESNPQSTVDSEPVTFKTLITFPSFTLNLTLTLKLSTRFCSPQFPIIPHKPLLHCLEVGIGVGVGARAGVWVNQPNMGLQLQGFQLEVELSLSIGPMLG
jgi:hypothetical protein